MCDMSLNKYDYCIVNMAHTDIMLNGHMDPTFCTNLPKYNQLQQLLHIIAKYVPHRNIPLKCQIYATYPN